MFLHIVLALSLGCLIGTITGIVPGIHINLVSVLLLSLSPILLNYTNPLVLCVFIISMAITHTFLDTIPSIFLGAPDSVDALNVLPGHRMLLAGKGYEAVKITITGSFLCLVLGIFITPLLILAAPKIFSILKPYIGYILILVILFMIIKEKSFENKLWSSIVFLISGIFGVVVFSLPNLEQPLFPMLSGLFGISTLLLSLSENTTIPKQEIKETIHVPKIATIKALLAGAFSGALTGIFPGLGAAQAAIIAMQLAGNIGNYGFMILVGGIGTVSSLFSLVTLYTLDKARDGAIVVVSEIIGELTISKFLVLLLTALIAGGLATILCMALTRGFSKFISKVNYKMLCISIIAFVATLVFYFSSFVGLLILAISTAIGLVSPLKNIGRNNAMGCLLLPVILYFVI